jgi:prepilin-type processing-associated H-X9-DG protein
MVRVLAATIVTAISLVVTTGAQAQQPFTVDELAQYRLTPAVFTPFEIASRSIAAVTRTDPALERDPLFTHEIMLSDDARAAASALETRLLAHPVIVRALADAKLTAREYTKFALALFAARLAHGFVKAGVLRRVPEGPAAANVAFVDAHVEEITVLLAGLGIDG